ncbi:MAG TPA: DUF4345 family protein [Acidimicrobiia bacterium]|nr:DUF4345 family protein [Acidimicrobiia bacterium]
MPERLVKVLLWALALTGLFVGVWALFGPQSFYDDFPGGGRSWVSVDGPYNEHLVRDVGAFNLALGLLAGWAAVRTGRNLVIGTALAWIAYGLPHAIYHSANLDLYSGADVPLLAIMTSITPIVAIALLVLPERASGEVRSSVRA